MIADLLPEDSRHIIGGSVEVNGIDRKDDEIYWTVSSVDISELFRLGLINHVHISAHEQSSSFPCKNIVSYVDQIDRLHGYLTVKETVEFAYQCCWG